MEGHLESPTRSRLEPCGPTPSSRCRMSTDGSQGQIQCPMGRCRSCLHPHKLGDAVAPWFPGRPYTNLNTAQSVVETVETVEMAVAEVVAIVLVVVTALVAVTLAVGGRVAVVLKAVQALAWRRGSCCVALCVNIFKA